MNHEYSAPFNHFKTNVISKSGWSIVYTEGLQELFLWIEFVLANSVNPLVFTVYHTTHLGISNYQRVNTNAFLHSE